MINAIKRKCTVTIRLFNTVFLEIYQRSPTAIRAARRDRAREAGKLQAA
jgi:hypothetical protein